MDAEGPHSYRVYADRFGSWAAALVEAGLDPTQHMTSEAILDEIRALGERVGCSQGGSAPTIAELTEHGAMSLHVVLHEFETWNEAVAAAGFVPNEGRPAYSTDVTETALLDDLRRVTATLDRTPTANEYAAHGEYGTTTYERRYGSWHRALALAGVQPRRQSPGQWARGTPSSERAEPAPGTPTHPQIDRITIEADGVPYSLGVGDLLIDWHSPLRTFEIHVIEVVAEALAPVWRVSTQPTTLTEPLTRTFSGEDLRAGFAEQTLVLRSE
jgi:hypothetical protein